MKRPLMVIVTLIALIVWIYLLPLLSLLNGPMDPILWKYYFGDFAYRGHAENSPLLFTIFALILAYQLVFPSKPLLQRLVWVLFAAWIAATLLSFFFAKPEDAGMGFLIAYLSLFAFAPVFALAHGWEAWRQFHLHAPRLGWVHAALAVVCAMASAYMLSTPWSLRM